MCLGEIGVVTSLWRDGEVPMATVLLGSREEPTCLLYVPDAEPGDHVLVQFGFAVEVLDHGRARDALRLRASAGLGP